MDGLAASAVTQSVSSLRPGVASATNEELGVVLKEKLAKQDTEDAIKKLNEKISFLDRQLNFSFDKEADAIVVQVIDRDTKEVIRQVPPEEILNVMRAVNEFLGLLLDTRI